MAAIRVLIVDDDAALLRMLNLAMTSAGFEARTAEDGIVALERLEAAPADVIILDLQMPRMDGREFFHEMTARGHHAQVVILSAFRAEEARRELRAAAAVSKPFDPDVLVDTVRQVAERGKAGSATRKR